MRTDDTATIAFAPGQGTAIEIAGETVATSAGPDLMDGVLDLWLGAGNEVDLLPHC